MAVTLDILSWIIIVVGAGFSIVGAIGLLRFPDFYTRLHAAGITDTLGVWLICSELCYRWKVGSSLSS